MSWKIPPKIKIYEALGAIADKRVKIYKTKPAKVKSSSLDKEYEVLYLPEEDILYSNDNGSYWQGYLGYPAVAFLMIKGELPYNEKFAKALKGMKWKEMNEKHRNDYDKVVKEVREIIREKDINLDRLDEFLEKVSKKISALDYKKPQEKKKPPKTIYKPKVYKDKRKR